MNFTHEIITLEDNIPVKLFDFITDNPNRRIPKHWHKSLEFLYCMSGSLIVSINSNIYEMHRNDLIVINSNIIHSTMSPEKSHILVMQIPLDLMVTFTKNTYNHDMLLQLNTVRYGNTASWLDKLREMLNKLLNYRSSSRLTSNIHSLGLIYASLALLIDECAVSADPKTINLNIKKLMPLNNILKYLQMNISRKVVLDEVASQFSYSNAYFSKYFKHYVGMNWTEYLDTLRLNEAKKEMLNSKKTFTEIAYDNGFGSYRNFYNVFKKIYSMSPRSFKKSKVHK